jgi:hypothetical protein
VVYCHGTKRREEFSSQRVVGGVAAQRSERAHPVALAAGGVGSDPGLFPELGRSDGLQDGFQLDVRFLERGDSRLEFMHTRTHTQGLNNVEILSTSEMGERPAKKSVVEFILPVSKDALPALILGPVMCLPEHIWLG